MQQAKTHKIKNKKMCGIALNGQKSSRHASFGSSRMNCIHGRTPIIAEDEDWFTLEASS
jgi:hypothetical protein